MIVSNNIIKAEQGNALLRKSDNTVFSSEISLGISYYKGDTYIPEGIQEYPEDYIEVINVTINNESVSVTPVETEEELISALIHYKYPINEEIALINNYIITPDAYLNKYSEYQKWRTQCKEAAAEYFKNIDIPLIKAKTEKLKEIDKYDTSSAVNSFTFKGQSIWIDKATRVGLVNSITIEKNAGKETTTLWFNNEEFTIPVDMALYMLSAIELYALECYNITARHKAEVSKLEDIDSINNYDITADYPQKLILG